MLNISVASTRINGRPKGRPRPFAKRANEQILYPQRIYSDLKKVFNWQLGVVYREAVGENKGNVRYQQDLYA